MRIVDRYGFAARKEQLCSSRETKVLLRKLENEDTAPNLQQRVCKWDGVMS